MKLSLLQNDIIWGNPKANQEACEKIMKSLDKSDVYVLPEMFSTGFATQPDGIAEADGSSLEWMKRIAAELDAAVCGSVATERPDYEKGEVVDENGEVKAAKAYYNRFYFVKPDGTYYYYDKHHLFTYGGEHKRYTQGDDRIVAEFRGVKFLLQVCYDLRFPTFARNRKNNPYDVALYVASWPTVRIEAWNTLLHARAIENQCYVAGVNRVGTDVACEYSGGTMLIDAYGKTVAECPRGEQSAVTVELDLEALKVFRKKFPVLDDAD